MIRVQLDSKLIMMKS